MAKQNIYDNENFFENFKNLRTDKINFNDCIETPILLAMIPEVNGKKVLDIGCVMGQHAKQYSDMGAESVLGIDISERMLASVYKGQYAPNRVISVIFCVILNRRTSSTPLSSALKITEIPAVGVFES